MTDVQWIVALGREECTINNCSLTSPRNLARVRKGDLYNLLVDLVALVHSTKRLEDPSSFKEAHAC